MREQGLSLVDLNREYLQQQELQQQLLTVLSDPAQRQAFLEAFDGNNQPQQQGQPNEQQQAQRQSFPGGAPGQQQQPQSLEGYYNQMQQAAAMGFPVDNLGAAYEMWDTIPNDAWRELAGTLIRGDY